MPEPPVFLACSVADCEEKSAYECLLPGCGVQFCPQHADEKLVRCDDQRHGEALRCTRFFCCSNHVEDLHSEADLPGLLPLPGDGFLCWNDCWQALCNEHNADRREVPCAGCEQPLCHSDHLPKECGFVCDQCRRVVCEFCLDPDHPRLCKQCVGHNSEEEDEDDDDDDEEEEMDED